jgi:hypothetical protein
LQVIVQGFHRMMVERVFHAFFLLRPNDRLARVRESHAAKIRHRICLQPDDIVQNPKAQILFSDNFIIYLLHGAA